MSLLVVALAGYGLVCLVGLGVAAAFCRAAAAGDESSELERLHLRDEGERLDAKGARARLNLRGAPERPGADGSDDQALRSGTGRVPAGEAAAVAQARPTGARRSKRRSRHATARRPAAAA